MKINIKKYGLCCFYAFSVMGCGNNQLEAHKRNVGDLQQQRFLRKNDQRELESQRHMNRSSQRILDGAPQWALNGETQWMLQAYQRMFNQAPQSTALRRPEWRGGFASLLFLTAYLSLVQGEEEEYALPPIPASIVPPEFFNTTLFNQIINSDKDLYPSCNHYNSLTLAAFYPIGSSQNYTIGLANTVDKKEECFKQLEKVYSGLEKILASEFERTTANLTLEGTPCNNTSKGEGDGPVGMSESEKKILKLKNKMYLKDAISLTFPSLTQQVSGTCNIYLFREVKEKIKYNYSPQDWFNKMCQNPLKEREKLSKEISVKIIKALLKDSEKCKDMQFQRVIVELIKTAENFARFGMFEESNFKVQELFRNRKSRNQETGSGHSQAIPQNPSVLDRVGRCFLKRRKGLEVQLLHTLNNKQTDVLRILDEIHTTNCTGMHWRCWKHISESSSHSKHIHICGDSQINQVNLTNKEVITLIGQLSDSTADLNTCWWPDSTRTRRHLNHTSHNHHHHKHRKHHHHKHHQLDQVGDV